jgi:putative nucleotidyltransferase with HDIG domain
MSKKVRLYVTLTIVSAAGAFCVLAALGGTQTAAEEKAAICFGLLAILADALQYKLEAPAVASIAFIPVMAIICLSPTWIAVALGGAAYLAGGVFGRQQPIKLAFNVAQFALSIAIAVLCYRLLGGQSLLRGDVRWPAYCAMFLAFMLVNSVTVGGVIALSQQQPFATVWRSTTGQALIYDLMSLPLPFIFSTVYLHFGAVGVVALAIPLLGTRQLYMTNRQLEKTNQDLLRLMVAAMEARDPYTSGHSTRVARNAKIIARAVGLGHKDMERVGVAALLHDVGKIHEIFAPLLRKPGKLTTDERLVMQSHPVKSAELVQNVSLLRDLVIPIRNHHERWDGTGYPDGLSGEAIPLWSRIIMFADTIDAMTTDRPYRGALGEADVRAEFVRLRGRQFDPNICDTLLDSPLYHQLFDRATATTPPSQMYWRRRLVGARVAAGA